MHRRFPPISSEVVSLSTWRIKCHVNTRLKYRVVPDFSLIWSTIYYSAWRSDMFAVLWTSLVNKMSFHKFNLWLPYEWRSWPMQGNLQGRCGSTLKVKFLVCAITLGQKNTLRKQLYCNCQTIWFAVYLPICSSRIQQQNNGLLRTRLPFIKSNFCSAAMWNMLYIICLFVKFKMYFQGR